MKNLNQDALESILPLDRNEYFFPHPSTVLQALSEGAQHASSYATQAAHSALTLALGSTLSVDPSLITLGHGAEDLLIKLLSWQRIHTHTLYLSDFSWGNYTAIADGLGFATRRIPCQESIPLDGCPTFTTDLGHLALQLEAQGLHRAVVLLASPNNPTGHPQDLEAMASLVERFPQHMFLIDGVYDAIASPLLGLAQNYGNCVFLGSFSKYFGLPGLRVGYCLGHNLPRAFHLALGMQPTALRACQAALENASYYAANRAVMTEFGKGFLRSQQGYWQAFPSAAPFVLVKLLGLRESEPPFQKQVERESGVRPKYLAHRGALYLRWGLGPQAINARIVKHMELWEELYSNFRTCQSFEKRRNLGVYC